ncbi:hypothetical protein C0991_001447, partial [Blastosporella zonata]
MAGTGTNKSITVDMPGTFDDASQGPHVKSTCTKTTVMPAEQADAAEPLASGNIDSMGSNDNLSSSPSSISNLDDKEAQ